MSALQNLKAADDLHCVQVDDWVLNVERKNILDENVEVKVLADVEWNVVIFGDVVDEVLARAQLALKVGELETLTLARIGPV